MDTGLACFLLGIRKPKHLTSHPLRGELFETFVVSEAFKQEAHAGGSGRFWFYRDSNGNEVDLIAENGASLAAWEVKSAMTISSSFFKGLSVLEKITNRLRSKTLLYCGEKRMKREGTEIVPWNQIDNLFI